LEAVELKLAWWQLKAFPTNKLASLPLELEVWQATNLWTETIEALIGIEENPRPIVPTFQSVAASSNIMIQRHLSPSSLPHGYTTQPQFHKAVVSQLFSRPATGFCVRLQRLSDVTGAGATRLLERGMVRYLLLSSFD